MFLYSPFNPPPAHFFEAMEQIPKARVESISSVGTYDILLSHDIVADKQALEWLISSVREHQQLAKADVYSGNAMVMRRRSLGLTDFPAEGEQDESKEMLEALEAEVNAGGAGGFELWRQKAVESAIEAKKTAEVDDREEVMRLGKQAKEIREMMVSQGVVDAEVKRPEQMMRDLLAKEANRAEKAEKAKEVKPKTRAEASAKQGKNAKRKLKLKQLTAEETEKEADSLVNTLK